MRGAVRDGAAVRALEQALLAEDLQVAADGGLADPEVARERADGHGTVAREQLEDAAEAVGSAHDPCTISEHELLASERLDRIYVQK